jgi:uncharacterized membrane protein
MVTVSKRQIIAQANCSASWRQNQCLLIILSCWGLLISLLFCLQGAWLILPLVSFELMLLAVVLFLVCKKIHQRHVLRFQQQQVTLEKGSCSPTLQWQLALSQTRISVERQQHPWSPIKIILCTAEETIPVGDFLNQQDSQILLCELRHKGLRVCNDSQTGSIIS